MEEYHDCIIGAMNTEPFTLKKFCSECKTKWFQKGRDSVLRQNTSGCCCLFNDKDEIVELCVAHKEYFDRKAISKKMHRPINLKATRPRANSE